MIRKGANRFSEKIMLKKEIEQDDESKRSHLAPGRGREAALAKIQASVPRRDHADRVYLAG
jgi:hypothetical protein